MIYCLIITDLNLLYNNYFENFTIGYFTSYEKALETANRYLTEIEGFNKYPCKYDITEKPISDFKELSENNLNIYTCLICPVCRYNTLKYVSIPAVLCLTQNKLSCV